MVLGNATRDPELRSTPNGRSVTSFAVATNRRWTDQTSGEQREEVQFHEIVAWGKLAEIASQIIRKGNKVYVEGRIQTRTWEGQDGARRERTEIIAENIIALSGRPGAPQEDAQYSQAAPEETSQDKSEEPPKKKEVENKKTSVEEEEINLDEIPF